MSTPGNNIPATDTLSNRRLALTPTRVHAERWFVAPPTVSRGTGGSRDAASGSLHRQRRLPHQRQVEEDGYGIPTPWLRSLPPLSRLLSAHVPVPRSSLPRTTPGPSPRPAPPPLPQAVRQVKDRRIRPMRTQVEIMLQPRFKIKTPVQSKILVKLQRKILLLCRLGDGLCQIHHVQSPKSRQTNSVSNWRTSRPPPEPCLSLSERSSPRWLVA